MQIVEPSELGSGFSATYVPEVIPEIVEVGRGEFKSAARVEPHVHRFSEFYFQPDGKTEWCAMGGRRFLLGPASFYSIAPNINHWLARSDRPGRYMSIGFDLGAVRARRPDVNGFELLGDIVSLNHVPDLESRFLNILRETIGVETPRESKLRQALDELVIAVIGLLVR